jgi:hypothetical protein
VENRPMVVAGGLRRKRLLDESGVPVQGRYSICSLAQAASSASMASCGFSLAALS